MYFVYILQNNKDNSLYTGCTSNIKKRLHQHNNNENISTKNKGGWKLIYFEVYIMKKDAYKREIFLKSGSGKRYLDKQLVHYFVKYPRKKVEK